ncbi:HNH endonuclease [Nocardioides aequoreus]|uniref:HNH endonuclease n=1 Tax=Nocardioides aequoreus TaxID=397278 RepID=UPI0014702F12|nr:HNH endonuclease signature motif containing protein [Nocardioides aequoreus]
MIDGVSAAELDGLVRRLASLDAQALDAEAQIDALALLERVKGAVAATQVRVVAAFDDGQRAADAARGVRPEAQGRGVAIQVGLAMRTSPARARRFVGMAHALRELPHTYDALADGVTSEYRAFLVTKETAHLSLEHRAAVDAELASRPGGIGALGDRTAESVSRAIGQRLDPAGAVRRRSRAAKARRVSLRPAPDGMSRLCATLPLVEGVATYATLQRAAESARASGDDRSRGAVMADELVGRVVAQAGDARTAGDVEVCLVMTDAALLGSDDPEEHHRPAEVHSASGLHGTVPADEARGVVRDAARVWLRRLHQDPATGELVAMDSRSRLFDGSLRRFLVLRDQQCRTPWCDAPVRHVDHVRCARDGGLTRADNAQGLCEACNQAKEHARLQQHPTLDGSVVTTTPTGHTYRSHRPRPPTPPPRIEWSVLERWSLERVPT